MNKDNIRTLISVLKKSQTFDMRDYNHDCGSPACISGHVVSILSLQLHGNKIYGLVPYYTLVQDFLGVSEEQAYLIINPTFKYADYSVSYHPHDDVPYEGYITKDHAIRMLERLLETGKVDWKESKLVQLRFEEKHNQEKVDEI